MTLESLETIVNEKYGLKIKTKLRRKKHIRARWVFAVVGLHTLQVKPELISAYLGQERTNVYNTIKQARMILEEEKRTGKYSLTTEIKEVIQKIINEDGK